MSAAVGPFSMGEMNARFNLRDVASQGASVIEPEPLSKPEMDDVDAMYERVGRTHYEVLGVALDANRPTVRSAYFNLAKRFHPDVFWDRDLGLYRPRIEEIFRAITVAFETLCDDHRRGEYDRVLDALKAPPTLASNDAVRVTTTGILRRPVELDRLDAVKGAAVEGARGALRVEAPRTPEPAPASEERVPKEITLQSLLRARGEHLARQRRERVAALEERVHAAEVRNDANEVLSLLREAATLAPGDAALHGRLQQAEANASGVAFERYRNIARMCEKDKRWDAAVEAWIRASNERPDDVSLLLSVVSASCEGLIELPRAADYARRATALDARNADAFALQARVFFLAGRMASARGAVENALRITPSHPGAVELSKRLKAR